MPQFEDMIFSAKKEAALELLDHSKGVSVLIMVLCGVYQLVWQKRS